MKQLTHKEFFEAEIQMGITPDNPAYLNLHYNLGRTIIERFNPKTTLEIGAGVGTLLEYLLKQGVNSVGIDLNPCEMDFFATRNPEFAPNYKICALQDYPFSTLHMPIIDVVVSIEVFEHIADADILKALPDMAKKCRWFLFSSTPETTDWDLMWGHINVKPTEEWVKLFSPHFDLVERLTAPTTWTLLFKSKYNE